MVLKLGALKIEKLRNRLGLDFENNLYKSTKQVQAARAFFSSLSTQFYSKQKMGG